MKAIVPFKKEGAKSRLKEFFNEEERENFAVAMLKDVLVTLSKSKIKEVTIITTSSTPELSLNLDYEIKVDGRELNEVLNEAIKEEKEPLLLIMADLPLAPPKEINEIIEHEEDIVIAPGRRGGTNALFLRRPIDFTVSYHGLSFLEHIEMAKLRKLSFAVYSSFFISTDIDEIEDLIDLLNQGKGFSVDYLRRIGVYLKVDKNVSVIRNFHRVH